MKKAILIKTFIGVFLLMSNVSEAGITKEERAKFDYHLKRIEKSQNINLNKPFLVTYS